MLSFSSRWVFLFNSVCFYLWLFPFFFHLYFCVWVMLLLWGRCCSEVAAALRSLMPCDRCCFEIAATLRSLLLWVRCCSEIAAALRSLLLCHRCLLLYALVAACFSSYALISCCLSRVAVCFCLNLCVFFTCDYFHFFFHLYFCVWVICLNVCERNVWL